MKLPPAPRKTTGCFLPPRGQRCTTAVSDGLDDVQRTRSEPFRLSTDAFGENGRRRVVVDRDRRRREVPGIVGAAAADRARTLVRPGVRRRRAAMRCRKSRRFPASSTVTGWLNQPLKSAPRAKLAVRPVGGSASILNGRLDWKLPAVGISSAACDTSCPASGRGSAIAGSQPLELTTVVGRYGPVEDDVVTAGASSAPTI